MTSKRISFLWANSNQAWRLPGVKLCLSHRQRKARNSADKCNLERFVFCFVRASSPSSSQHVSPECCLTALSAFSVVYVGAKLSVIRACLVHIFMIVRTEFNFNDYPVVADDSRNFNFYSWEWSWSGKWTTNRRPKQESITRHFSSIVRFVIFLLAISQVAETIFLFQSIRPAPELFAYKSRTRERGQKWKMCQHKNFFPSFRAGVAEISCLFGSKKAKNSFEWKKIENLQHESK